MKYADLTDDQKTAISETIALALDMSAHATDYKAAERAHAVTISAALQGRAVKAPLLDTAGARMNRAVKSWRSGVQEIVDALDEDETIPHPTTGEPIARRQIVLIPTEMLVIDGRI